jgi:multisubunit Na+/H+ antiporter MnhG subunit
MYDNIGSKIKTLAIVLCVIGIIGCIISGIVFLAEIEVVKGLLFLLLGPVLSWVGSFCMYGLGQAVENTEILISKMNKVNSDKAPKNENLSKEVGTEVKSEVGKCDFCGKITIVTKCKIVDDMGTRYRNLCMECKEKREKENSQ